jgi:Arc/MetJ family transcription regulator
MTKRLIDIDDEVLEEAKRLLGAKSNKETVNTALRDVIAAAARRRHIERITSPGYHNDLADPAVMDSAWR